MFLLPLLEQRCLAWGIPFYVQSDSSISEQKEEPMGRGWGQEVGSWLPLGMGSIPRALGVGPRQGGGRWGQTARCEVLSTQASGQETTQFFLTEVLQLS